MVSWISSAIGREARLATESNDIAYVNHSFSSSKLRQNWSRSSVHEFDRVAISFRPDSNFRLRGRSTIVELDGMLDTSNTWRIVISVRYSVMLQCDTNDLSLHTRFYD